MNNARLRLAFLLAATSISFNILGAGRAQALDPTVASPVIQSKTDLSMSLVQHATGAASYVYTFSLPPGRGVGLAVALSYSTAGSIRGDIAEGWTLQLPSIRREVSHDSGPADAQYSAYLGGKVQDLHQVMEAMMKPELVN